MRSNVNYPYPVLNSSNDDFLNCSFDIEMIDEPSADSDAIIFNIKYNLVCDGLKKYISDDSARVVLYFESVNTEYRKIVQFPKDQDAINLVIHKSEISKNLEIRGYIVAAKHIDKYHLPEHNPELFGGLPFSIRHGDMLAISKNFYNIPLTNYDPLANRPSIFSIRHQTQNPQEEIVVDINTQSGKIDVILYKDIYDKYQKLYEAPETRTVLATMFAAPILVDVLHQLKFMSDDEKETYSSKKWYQVVDKRLKDLKIELENEICMTNVANLILPHIFDTTIQSFTELCDVLIKKGGSESEN